MWKTIAFNIVFALNCLLAFLLVFESGLSVPVWLQVFGRMHPLLLHIPIGLLLLYAVIELFFPLRKIQDQAVDLKDALLLSGALTISLTALMGLFLTNEPGYEPETIALHKWGGAAISFLLMAWYHWREHIRRRPLLNKTVAALSIALVSFTGHQGGSITHGENFLLGPILPKEDDPANLPFDEAVVFTHMAMPIIKQKCISCHNEKKAKGELIMTTAEQMLQGGKNGKLWDTTAQDLGSMIKRIHLPLSHDDHMPPKGKPQLTDQEIAILEAWIRGGSNMTIKVSELDKSDTLAILAAAMFSNDQREDVYDLEAASAATVESLNNFYRAVKPLAENSPALSVSFFGREQFTPDQLLELKPVSQQVVEMDLSRMPIKDEDLAIIAQFPHLRKLNLNFTDIGGEGLAALKGLSYLKELSLAGTGAQVSFLSVLKDLPGLKKIFLWNTPVSNEEIKALRQIHKNIVFESGFDGDTLVLKLTPPIIDHEQFVLSEPTPLKLKHNINGVEIRYTLDGTEPDSIRSPVFHSDIAIDNPVELKTKAYRKGWISSDIASSRFYRSGLKPQSVKLLVQPDPYYAGSRERTLFDLELGGRSLGSGKWLGYSGMQALDVWLDFESPAQGSSFTLSCFSDNRRAFPPESITIWYGNDSLQMKKLQTLQLKTPAKSDQTGSIAITMDLPKEPFRYLRAQARPISRIPEWSSAKGKPGWLYIDEIILK
ncbi:MAG TPA: FN3 associated domain-containing protein [Flavitalea sp.]|nr:FN3 associated domain-containing protein [Flavitalea sp.]